MYPLTADLAGRPVLVVGAGRVATRKIVTLLRAEARVTVVSPEGSADVRELFESGKITWKRRKFRTGDLRGVFLAIAAADVSTVNAHVFRAAERRRLLVNSVDDPANSSFHVPACVSRGKLTVAISTSGESPYFARRFKMFLDAFLPADLGSQVEKLGKMRRATLETAPTDETMRAGLVRKALDDEIDHILAGLTK